MKDDLKFLWLAPTVLSFFVIMLCATDPHETFDCDGVRVVSVLNYNALKLILVLWSAIIMIYSVVQLSKK